MKKFEVAFLSVLLVLTVMLCTIFGAGMAVSAEKTVLYQSDYEEEGAKSVIRAENGNSSVVSDLPGDREGHAIEMFIEKNLIGVHPKDLGAELYKYGYFKEGDTFHFALDLYFDTDKSFGVSPFVLLCIFGEDFNKKENYDEWYPSTGAGTLTVNEGPSTIQGRTWTRLDYTYTVKNGCSSKGRDISFWKDGGCFYISVEGLGFDSYMPIYVDNVIIEVDTENEPTRTTTTTTTTRVTYESQTSTTTAAASEEPSEDPSSEPTVAGDVNGDNSMDMKDVLLVRKFIAGMDTETDVSAADLNGDNSVDMKDVLMMRKIIAGLIVFVGEIV